jgi:hypothetical protein
VNLRSSQAQRRYEVGYNKPIHGTWGLQFITTLETDDLEEARAEIRKQRAAGNTRGLLMYDTIEKIIYTQPNAEGGFG